MKSIIGISGSLRTGSFNTALLKAAMKLAPEGVTIEHAAIDQIPLYNGDVEARDGIPPAVAALKDRIAESAGVLIATPEYNNSLPGVLKNAIDWLSRPSSDIDRVFKGRAVAIIGASPGPYGTILSQSAWLPVVRTLRMRPWLEGRLMVSRANTVFDAAGEIVDESTHRRLSDFVQGFAQFIGR
jgi:NAD(P)H-dependent FMN reductase